MKINLKKFGYRGIICSVITLGFVLLAFFRFDYSYKRFFESIIDFGLSFKYFFEYIFLDITEGMPSVAEFSRVPYVPPFFLPASWEEFKQLWALYWQMIVSAENIGEYLDFTGTLLLNLSRFLIIALPIIFIAFSFVEHAFHKQNNDDNKQSKPLIRFKKFVDKVYNPIKNWCKNSLQYLKDNCVWLYLWLVIWLFSFNFATIIIEFFAFYFYFVCSFDFLHLYVQVAKLLIDLSIVIFFLPLPVWIIIGYAVFCAVRRKIGYARLNHNEQTNRRFINDLPIVFMIVGSMGTGKTTMLTDTARSVEVIFRNKAFELLLDNDLKFPDFPWINLERYIKQCMERHEIYNLATIRKRIDSLKALFYLSISDNPAYQKAARRRCRRKFGLKDICFGYDFERYGLYYDDKLKVVDVWEIIDNYARLYFIYVIESSLMFANLSIRSDEILLSAGNFPRWSDDFFKTDSSTIDCYARHSHILDYDSLRLGRKVCENDKFRNSFEFGIVVTTEIGKERGNALENIEKKKSDDEANPKNDGFDNWLKMSRHLATVDNYPFIKVHTDEQRLSSWGANARDLCKIIDIRSRSDLHLLMPGFTLAEFIFSWLEPKFNNKYYTYRYNRSDNTLLMYLLKGAFSRFYNWYKGIYNTFGCYCLNLNVQRGTLDDEAEKACYYISTKKAYGRVFATDCHGDFFLKKSLESEFGIVDIPEYESERATIDELKQQNSYFIRELDNITKNLK